MAPRLPPRAVLNLLFAGFTLRWMGLERLGLWLDEGATWSWTRLPTWGETALAEANHPPAWWLVTRAFTSWLGDSEEVLRLPAALCSVLTIWLAWCLGRRLLMPSHAPRRGGFLPPGDDADGQRAATWFTGFIAASAFLIELGQEARMYALLVAQSLGLVLLWLRWLDRGSRGTLVAYALLAAVALYTHYFALWPILSVAAHAAWLAWRTRRAPPGERVPLRPVVVAHAVAALLFAPWVAFLLGHYEGMHRATHSVLGALAVLAWRVGIGPALVAFDAGRAGQGVAGVWAQDGLWVATSVLLWVPLVLRGAWSLRRRPGVGPLAGCMLAVPVLGVLALLPWFMLVHERYLCFVAPWLWLLALLGAWSLGPRLRALGLAALGLLCALGLCAYHLTGTGMVAVGGGPVVGGYPTPTAVVPDPQDPARVLHRGTPYGKEPWREAAQLVHAYSADGDLVLLHPPFLRLVWDYYGRTRTGGALETATLPAEVPGEQALLDTLGPRLRDRKRVFLVVSHAPSLPPEAVYERIYKVVGAAWHAAGAGGFEASRLIPLQRSWGIHVAIFRRT